MSERDLRSTTYDGVTITTRWEDWARREHTPARYVRPARHAYVRSRHFRRAANRIRFRNMMLGCPVGHQIAEANRAAENAAWGCDPEQHVKRPDS